MRETLFDYCKRTGELELLRQWNSERNGALTPETVSYGSKKKVWWRCEKGHEWQAEVKTRVNGCGCPVCANRKLAEGENDLATLRPELAAQWHPTRNGSLTPGDLTAGTRRKVWWRCDKGHEWQASVLSRTSLGNGCPVCAGKQIIPGENDLASQFPQLAAQWHPDKNGALRPENVSPNSNRKVWWLCPLGHAWKATVTSRSREGAGCPFCAGRKVWPGFNDLETDAERPVDAQNGDGWEPEKGLVAVPGGTCVEGGRLLQGWKTKVRLSGLCRTDQRSADEGIPAHGGGTARENGALNGCSLHG